MNDLPGVRSGLRLTGKSELAIELAELDPNVRDMLGLPNALVTLVDMMIAAARLLTDDTDSRPWHARLGDLDEWFEDFAVEGSDIHQALRALEELVNDPSSMLARFDTPNVQRFVHRLLGEAKYQRLLSALKSDAAVVVLGTRRGVRNLMPLALALDDCVAFMTPGQFATLEGFGQLGSSMLRMVVGLDSALDKVVDLGLPLKEFTSREDELAALVDDVPGKIDRIAVDLHEVLEGESSAILLDLSSRLARKVRGARDVVDTSADGVSQAANSLIEFIDRMLREAFDDEYVLGWLDRNKERSGEFVYADRSGVVRPTKRAQALCFSFGGRDYTEPMLFNEMSAAGLAAARTELQRLKHSDEGTEEEVHLVRRLVAAVEGFTVFAVRVGWTGLPEAEVSALRSRLGRLPQAS